MGHNDVQEDMLPSLESTIKNSMNGFLKVACRLEKRFMNPGSLLALSPGMSLSITKIRLE